MHIPEFPYIADENDDFAVVYKPPCMHSAPACAHNGDSLTGAMMQSLTEWYALRYPGIFSVTGRKAGEGGIMHRLDYHTRGLVLFAKNQNTYNTLQKAQDDGCFIKKYSALCLKEPVTRPGFPESPEAAGKTGVIESYFRSYEKGRKEVRPVSDSSYQFRAIAADRGKPYRTEILSISALPSVTALQSDAALPVDRARGKKSELYFFDILLRRGFRHQIRCHLEWAGYPILNDPVYGKTEPVGAGSREGAGNETAYLALCSYGMSFPWQGAESGQYSINCRELAIAP
ncbi:MAG: RNA pseudouridine synthase [Treponema sp.]|nr:RNA pseudouridine synthase [Treponema sp.]